MTKEKNILLCWIRKRICKRGNTLQIYNQFFFFFLNQEWNLHNLILVKDKKEKPMNRKLFNVRCGFTMSKSKFMQKLIHFYASFEHTTRAIYEKQRGKLNSKLRLIVNAWPPSVNIIDIGSAIKFAFGILATLRGPFEVRMQRPLNWMCSRYQWN